MQSKDIGHVDPREGVRSNGEPSLVGRTRNQLMNKSESIGRRGCSGRGERRSSDAVEEILIPTGGIDSEMGMTLHVSHRPRFNNGMSFFPPEIRLTSLFA